jgi:hypothetical protein
MTTCKHENFCLDATINRLEDLGAFIADIKIFCIDCGTKFCFPPLPMGLNCSEATINLDATEMRVPIRPFDQAEFKAFIGFDVIKAELQ